jgi:hypothetical protein
MMPKQANSANLRLCQTRAEVPGGSQLDRERDFARTMRRQRMHLVNDELDRKSSSNSHAAPAGLLSRLRQIVDLLLGRGHVWVERRQPPTRN